METPTPDWDILQGKNIWPDRVMYKIDETGKIHAVFVLDRANNRSLPVDKVMLLKLFELLGLTVRVQVSGALFSLDEFQSGKAYLLNPQGLSQQQIYNSRSELKRLEILLASTPEASPKYADLKRVVETKRAMLGSMTNANEIVKTVEEASTNNPNRTKLRNALRMQGKHGEELEKEVDTKLLTMTADQIQQELDQATESFKQRREQ